MRAFFTRAKRGLSLSLVLGLLTSSMNLGLIAQAFAPEIQTISAGELVAKNYELTDAEKALLESGNLADGGYKYVAPTDADLISVDTDAKSVAAESYTDDYGNVWTATKANIMVGSSVEETVKLVNGEGKYSYAGNAFTVAVTYEMSIEVDEETQTSLLNVSGYLKDGVDNLDAIYDIDGELATIGLAVPTLMELANGMTVPVTVAGNTVNVTITMVESAGNAVRAMNEQVEKNGDDLLDLAALNMSYGAADSKTGYLMENGETVKAEAEELLGLLNAILEAESKQETSVLKNKYLTDYLKENDKPTYNMLRLLTGSMEDVAETLDAVTAEPWDALTCDLLVGGVNYLQLDELVADLTTITTGHTVFNPLKAASAEVKANLAMYNVAVTVETYEVEDKADSALLVCTNSETTTLTLAEGAGRDAIEAAIEAGVDLDYDEEHFTAELSALPGSLTEDIEVTITIEPKEYTVSYGYTTSAPTSVPYGYQLTLPAHENAEKAYDYTVNGEYYAQKSVYVVVGDTEITREAGKAYNTTGLYAVIADNYANEDLAAILNSGALNNDEVINVRKPDPADAESLVKLENDKLTVVGKYAADYEGLFWVPYSYGVEGDENLFDGATTVDWTEASVKVTYILSLENYSAGKVELILETAAGLKEEADTQVETLDKLAAYHGTMKQLDKTKLGALKGVIGVTEFSTDAAKNQELQDYFTGLVNGIIENNVATNGYLNIYNILGAYLDENTGGLTYYYNNSETVINEIDSLSGYLSGMLADEEKEAALYVMVSAAGFPEYAEKIADLEGIMASVKAALTAPNAMIDLDSPNLYKLIAVLESDGQPEATGSGYPYLISETLSAVDDSKAVVQVSVTVGGKTQVFTTPEFDRGDALTQDAVDALIVKVEDFAKAQLGGNFDLYEASGLEELQAMVGQALTQKMTTVYVTYTAIEFTVEIEGADDVTVSVESAQITLPAHNKAGYVYTYTIQGKTYEVGQTAVTITLTPEMLAAIVDGTLVVTREESNKAAEDLEDNVGSATVLELVKDDNGDIIGMVANLAPNQTSLMNFAMELIGLGYSYIELNGEPLMDTGVISLQTLMNAILNDNSFGSKSIIALGKNNGGKVFSAKMNMGNDANNIMFSDLDFTFNMVGAPSALGTVSTGLAAIDDYMTFQAQNGVMVVELNLPEKVYEVYLTALLATGNVDKSDVNAINDAIAYQFLYDYVETIISSDADATSFTNTLKMLGQNRDLSGYDKYYQMIKKALTNEGVKINEIEDENFEMSVTAKGKTAIDGLMGLIGINPANYTMELAMVKEYAENSELSVSAVATLGNLPTTYEALVLDVNAGGVTNKFDYTANLPARAASIANNSMIILLDDVDGDLVFNGANTVLDLNGKTVDGDITANGRLVIVSSAMDTLNAGAVTGSVSGNVTVVAGNYAANSGVEAYLCEGYIFENGAVSNEFYTIAEDTEGNITFNLSADILAMSKDDVKAFTSNDILILAADMALDLAMNYYTTAALTVDGNGIYAFDDQFADLIGLYAGAKDASTINEILSIIDMEGIEKVINNFLAEALDFAAISTAIENGEALFVDTVKTAPWKVCVDYVANGDYVTVGLTNNADLAKEVEIGVKIVGDNKDELVDLNGELGKIVNSAEVSVDLNDLTYAGNMIDITAAAKAVADVDMSKDSNYAVIIGVALAYAGVSNKADFVAALNTYYADGTTTALKNAFEAAKISDLTHGLKDLSMGTNFAAMVNAIGLDASAAAEASELEGVFHKYLVGIGFVLEYLDVVGPGVTMKQLNSNAGGAYGTYLADKSVSRDGSKVIAAGFGVSYDLALTEISLKVKLFAPETVVDFVPVTDITGVPAEGTVGEALELTATVAPADATNSTIVWTVKSGDATLNGNKLTAAAEGIVVVTATIVDGTAVGTDFVKDFEITFTEPSGPNPPPPPVPGHVHDWDADWSYNSTHHWHDCLADDCNLKDGASKYKDGYAVHIYANGVDGDCTICDYYKAPADDDDNDFGGGGGGGHYCPSKKFKDLDVTKWYHLFTDYVLQYDLMAGLGDWKFGPDMTTTRAMIVTTLYNMEGRPAVGTASGFTDVAEGMWYAAPVAWAVKNGVVAGYGDGTFGPNDPVTREQIAVIFRNYAAFTGMNVDYADDLSDFVDADTVSFWAKDAVGWSVATSMMKGTDVTVKTLAPKDGTTRAMLATMLTKWCKYYAD